MKGGENNQMKKRIFFLLLMVILFWAGGVATAYFYLFPKPQQYPEAVQWAIDNPSYTEKVYQAYKLHVKAAESLLQEELGALGDKNRGN